jgi:hypothetical protein
MRTNEPITKGLAVACVMAFVGTCAVGVVLAHECMPSPHDKLVRDLGFMHMDLDQLRDYFQYNATYQADPEGIGFEWKEPRQFHADGGGDCEDYVIFALAVLDHSKYQLTPCLGTYNGGSHAFLLAYAFGSNYLIDTAGVRLLSDGKLPSGYVVSQTFDDMLRGGLF